MPLVYNDCYMRTPFEFVQLARELLQTTPDKMVGLKLLPDENKANHNFFLLKKRPFKGRLNWRGLDGNATPTRAPFSYENDGCMIRPGYWSEYQEVDERMLRTVSTPGTHSAPFDLVEYERELMFDISMKLHQLKESLIWQALVNGYLEERNAEGLIVWSQRYKITRARFTISACDRQNSTPLADLACIVNSVVGVVGAAFDSDAVMYANSRTWECLLRNTNPLDIGRMSLSACCDAVGMARLAQFFQARGLPRPEVYNGFWIDEAGRSNFYIPTGKIVVVGRRFDNQRIGAFYQAPTLVSAVVPGTGNTSESNDARSPLSFYGEYGTFVVRQDNTDPASRLQWLGSRRIRWTYGMYGIPVLEYPTSVIVVDTGCADCECGPLAEVCPQ
jgi:hypothetical protein